MPRTEIVGDRVHYKRTVEEGYTNPYNPFFLRLLEVNMDMQINIGNRALYYLAKYLTKNVISSGLSMDIPGKTMETSNIHFKNRVAGSVEAVYDIMGWAKQKSSVGVTFLNTNLPEDDRRQLVRDIGSLAPNNNKIFTKSHIEKYCRRSLLLGDLTFPQYFTFYTIRMTSEAMEQAFNDGMEMDVEDDRVVVDEPMVQTTFHDQLLPAAVTDMDNRKYRLRTRIPLWRTKFTQPSAGEAYLYQQVVLYHSSMDFEAERLSVPCGTWRGM